MYIYIVVYFFGLVHLSGSNVCSWDFTQCKPTNHHILYTQVFSSLFWAVKLVACDALPLPFEKGGEGDGRA